MLCSRISLQVLRYQPNGRRSLGRPYRRWNETLRRWNKSLQTVEWHPTDTGMRPWDAGMSPYRRWNETVTGCWWWWWILYSHLVFPIRVLTVLGKECNIQDVHDLRTSDLRTSALTNRRPTCTHPDLRTVVHATNMGIAIRFRAPNKRLPNGNLERNPFVNRGPLVLAS
jgi:hypothetical protein